VVGAVISFLGSPAARWITGQDIQVDGGFVTCMTSGAPVQLWTELYCKLYSSFSRMPVRSTMLETSGEKPGTGRHGRRDVRPPS
jgi:hypothetical protein